MTRRSGGFRGAKPTWTTTSTSGIFGMEDVVDLKAAGQWPRGPAAPTNLAATAGNAQVALTWTAPATTHGTITNYAVEYTPSGGSPTVVATGSTAASYTVTGLTNGTAYTFRVAAVNHTVGDYSDSVAATPSSIPQVVAWSGGSGTFQGEGFTGANKRYARDGDYNGRPKYVANFVYGGQYVFEIRWSGSVWQHRVFDGASPWTMSNSTDSVSPPSTGWTDPWGGSPTLNVVT